MQSEAFERQDKTEIRRHLREILTTLGEAQRHSKSIAACSFITATREFQSAKTVMLYLSTPLEVDTAPLALRAWQQGKTVVVPKVSWDARRMVPVEISSFSSDHLTLTGKGFREPVSGNPYPMSQIDLLVVPGLGFTEQGHRIGRGMGFYDRFLSQPDFLGTTIGLAFEEQIVPYIPMLDHDVPLCMLATDRGIRRVRAPSIARCMI